MTFWNFENDRAKKGGAKNCGFTMLQILLVCLIIGLLAVCALPAKAQGLQPFQPNYLTTPTNLTATGWFTNVSSFTLTNGQYLVLTSGGADTIRQYNGESLLDSVTWTNPAITSAGLTKWWDVTADGSNYTTTHPFVTFTPQNGTNSSVSWTNLPIQTLDNVRYIKLYAVSNSLVGGGPASNTATINWLQFSRSQLTKY